MDDAPPLVEQHPGLLNEALDSLFEQLRGEYAEDEQALGLLAFKQALLHGCREQGSAATFDALRRAAAAQRPMPLLAALTQFQALVQAAQEAEQDAALWQRTTEAGEALLALPHDELPVDEAALAALVAQQWNSLGNTLDKTDKEAALAAFDRAIALQPDFAMWRRNRAGTLIALQRLDEAEAELGRALDADAPRVEALAAQLAAARGTAR